MENYDNVEQLSSYRQTIDNLDAALIHILAERFRCTHKIGKLKVACNLPEVDKCREEFQFNRLKAIAQNANLDQNFVESLMRFIINEVIHRHGQMRS